MELSEYELEFNLEANEAIDNLEKNLSKISVGSANPQLVSKLNINYYDSLMSIGDIATISHPSSQQLLIKPFDHSITKEIYSIIIKQNYSLTVQDEGDKVRLIFPTLTTEKRKESVKQLSSVKENAKIRIRNIRQNILKKIKTDKTLSEDVMKNYQNSIQKIVDSFNEKIDSIIRDKEKQLMKI